MKRALVALAAIVARAYLRYVPISVGKRWLWHEVIERYIAWRPGRHVARTRFGATFVTTFPDVIQTRIYFFGLWEPVVTKYVAATLRPGDTFVDVGSNIGYYALLASRQVGPGGRVYAIEASPAIYEQLRENLSANGAGNVTAINMAVADKPCRVAIYQGGVENIGATTIVENGESAAAVVAAAPLGDIIDPAEIRTARLIKVDVEGAEWLVLSGMRPLLEGLSPNTELVIEINAAALRRFGASVAEFIDIFREAGFAPFEIDNDYSIDLYVRPRKLALRPCRDVDFAQRDIVFRRV